MTRAMRKRPETTERAPGTVRRFAYAFPLLACLAAGCVSTGPRSGFDVGFVASSDTSLSGQARVRALGPFVEYQRGDEGNTFLAVRPFYSHVNDPTNDCSLTEILWPLGMYKDAFGDTYWRFLTAFGNDFDSDSPDSRYRFVVFPFIFTGRDKEGDGYFALFPLGGTIKEMLGRDDIAFGLFPLYASSSVGEKESTSILWPILGWTSGEGVEKFRVFPFYGRYENTDRFTKRFIMWPFWTSVRYEYPEYVGGGFVLFPIMGHVLAEGLQAQGQESWMVLPPFFRWSRNARGYRLIHCPWPFVQYRAGKEERLYIWPLWGRRKRDDFRSYFALWPFFHVERLETHVDTYKRFSAVPFVYSERRLVREKDDETASRYLKLWPLATYRREGDRSRFRTPALWPKQHAAGVERNWAPLWTLYSRERNGPAVEHELLWGLVRRRKSEEARSLSVFPLFQSSGESDAEGHRKWSLLYGLLGYERDGLRRNHRLLYFINIGRSKENDDQEAVPVSTEQ